MSINSLANAALARRPDMRPAGRVPSGAREIAAAAVPADRRSTAAPAASPADTALNILIGYIPTEVLTLYVAARAAVKAAEGTADAEWVIFWIFLALTPIVFWLVFAAKLRGLGQALPTSWGTWPLWEMFCATLAFAVWAFALPDSPFLTLGKFVPAVSVIAVLVTSTMLGLISSVVQRPLGTGGTPVPVPAS